MMLQMWLPLLAILHRQSQMFFPLNLQDTENLVTSVACSEVGNLDLEHLGCSLSGPWHAALLLWDSVSPSVRWVSRAWVFWQQLRKAWGYLWSWTRAVRKDRSGLELCYAPNLSSLGPAWRSRCEGLPASSSRALSD